MKTLIGLFIATILLAGCSTNFPSPSRLSCKDQPYIQVTMQGSMPSASIYRTQFYIMNDTNGTNTRAFFTPEIIAQMAAEILKSAGEITANTTEKYYDTLKTNYRWRTDVFVYGITNLNESQIYSIIKYSTRPQVDAQRPPVIGQEE